MKEHDETSQVVWIFNHYASTPDQPMTGSYYFSKALAEKGLKVTTFASSFSYYKRKEIRLKKFHLFKNEELDNMNYVWCRTTPYNKSLIFRTINMLSFFFITLLVMFRIRPKPDIIIGTCPHLFSVYAALLCSRLYKCKFVFEVRDLWPQTFIDHGQLKNSSIIIKVLRALEKRLYKKADLIVTVLPFVHKYIESLNIKLKNVIWIPNGINFNSVPEIDKMQDKYAKNFMYLGGHAKYQGLYTLLDAAAILQNEGYDFKLILVGDGVEKESLKSYAEKNSISSIDFRDPVPRRDLPLVMQEAGCFIYHLKHFDALKYGISPNKLCDYMISKRPIISAVKSPNNPVKDANCGISILPENPQSMADAMKVMLSMSYDDKLALGKNGYTYARNNYDVNVLANRFINNI